MYALIASEVKRARSRELPCAVMFGVPQQMHISLNIYLSHMVHRTKNKVRFH